VIFLHVRTGGLETVTSVEVKGQMDQHIRDNLRFQH
jgi:hypothetical protein